MREYTLTDPEEIVLISTPNLSDENDSWRFLLWRNELQSGQQFAEIKDLDRCPTDSDVPSRTP